MQPEYRTPSNNWSAIGFDHGSMGFEGWDG